MAQEEEFTWMDSIYTVPPPVGYVMPFDTMDIIEAASSSFSPWTEDALDEFDTTGVLSSEMLEEVLINYDYIPAVSDEVIKDRLIALEQDVPLNYHERVRRFIDFFSVKRRAYTLTILQRKNIYFPMFDRIFKEEGVPTELKYLAIVESAFKPRAVSRVGARGLWQFMPRTGRAYGLKQDSHIDERMDPEQATRAAAKYLKFLYKYHGDWELAIAAYNCGPGNIRKAQRRSGKYHFWDIYHKLPRETRSYLPQFVAMMYVLNYADEHNLHQAAPDYDIPAAEIFVSQSVDLKKLGDQIGVCEEDLLLMNPKLRWGYVPGGVKNFGVKIPESRYKMFESNRDSILAKIKYTGQGGNYKDGFYYHVVRRGESLGLIASRNRVKLWELKSWNNLRSNTIYPGQKLKIYGQGYKAPAPKSTASSSSSRSSVTSSKYHTVRRGDTVGGIARRYGISASNLRKWNGLNGNLIKAGERLAVAPPTSKSSTTSNVTKKSTSGATKYHIVRKGDSLWEIAKKNGVTVSELKKWNNLKSNSLRPGQKLKVKS
ncbi:hypothetical protein GCM10023331_15810 [Algivirga pacifica]|uniref:LysM domain-containing protein n=2 Tax=Algivirga pacifica TaxID=1162670 RepID=A0ABP9D606_9BACT